MTKNKDWSSIIKTKVAPQNVIKSSFCYNMCFRATEFACIPLFSVPILYNQLWKNELSGELLHFIWHPLGLKNMFHAK